VRCTTLSRADYQRFPFYLNGSDSYLGKEAMCILQKIINSPGESVVPFSGRARWITCMAFRKCPSVSPCHIKRTQYADVKGELWRPPSTI